MSDTQIYQPKRAKEQSFGKYRVTRELGRGAMGVVYECFDPDFERAVAVKILSPDLLKHDTSGEYRQRFRNEMKAAGRLAHPNVISVFDAGEQEGVPYFVMEYVDGTELKDALDDGQRFETAKVVKLMREVLAGLRYIHNHNIIHRDLKPANIFITSEGSAKITDFGIAKLESSELTRVGTIIGSPRYMSPEQCQGLPVDARSDLFTAGIIFYQLLTNEHCFDANSPTAIMQKIIHSSPENPSVLIPTLNKAYDTIIQKALEKSPDKRFQTAEEFIEALDSAASGKVSKKTKSDSKSPLMMVAISFVAVALGAAGVYFVPKLVDFTGSTSSSVSTGVQTSETSSQTAQTQPESGSDKDNSVASTGNGEDQDAAKDGTQVAMNVGTDSATASDPESMDSSLSPENQEKVKSLLRLAEVYMLQERLIAPSGSSAYDAYQLVFNYDPGNGKALDGLRKVEAKLIDRINKLLEEDKRTLALAQAEAGVKLFPYSQQLAKLSK